jgi:anti-sigma-K factor RskA
VNVKEYIASGIVESYVLGLATPEEMAEFERMCAAHHEVMLAREAFEKQLEQHALKNGINPPVHLQSKIFAELEVEADKLRNNGTVAPYTDGVQQAPVVTMRWWKYAAVAAILLFVGSAALNFYFLNRFKTYKNLYLASISETAQMRDSMRAQMTAYTNSLQVLRDTNMAIVRMKGMPEYPQGMATVYWDKQTKDVYLMVNNLPKPAAGKQYQLWAIVNGQPVDAGMLNWNDATIVASMKNIPQAQAFAITLEDEGGHPLPQGVMYVLGSI